MARFEHPETPPPGPTRAAPRRRPPFWRLAPATFGISVLCGALFVASLAWPSIVDRGAMVPDAIWSGEAWRLVTSVFLHGGPLHVAFNVLWFVSLGSAIEARYGGLAVLALTLLTGVAGGAAEMVAAGLRYGGAVGLSGAVYGLFFFGFIALRPLGGPFAGLFSKANAWLLAGWGVLAFVLTYFDFARIGNFAHLAGAVSGALVGVTMYLRGGRRLAMGAATFVLLGALGLAAWRPTFNPRWQLWRAVTFFDDGRPDRAVPLFAELAERHPDQARFQGLYALSLAAAGRPGEARQVWDAIPEAELKKLSPQVRLMYQDLVRAAAEGAPTKSPPEPLD